MRALKILYEDEFLLAADKPPGFYSMPSEDKSLPHSFHWDAWHILEKQKGQRLYPAHRLDRATSGVLLFSKVREANGAIQRQFQEREVSKFYLCLARGAFQGQSWIDTPLAKPDGTSETARTYVDCLAQFKLPIEGPDGGHRTFSLLGVQPETGRFHQIRRHLAGIGTPLVGDQAHGDKKLNRLFREWIGVNILWLRCMRIDLRHPQSGEPISLRTRFSPAWHRLFEQAGLCALWPLENPVGSPPNSIKSSR